MKKLQFTVILLSVLLFLQSSGYQNRNFGLLVDKRDGKSYKTKKFGNKEWMIENLNYKSKNAISYENKEDFAKVFGRLYTWEEVKTVCPQGWHLPSSIEWEALVQAVGGNKNNARQKLLDAGFLYSKQTKFNASYAGYRDYGGRFQAAANEAYFWASNQYDSKNAQSAHIYSRGKQTLIVGALNKKSALSCRCVKN